MFLSQLFSVSHGNLVVAEIDFRELRINTDFLIFPLLHSQEAKYTAGAAAKGYEYMAELQLKVDGQG